MRTKTKTKKKTKKKKKKNKKTKKKKSFIFGYHHARMDRELRGTVEVLPWPVAKRKTSTKFDLVTSTKVLLKSQWMNFSLLIMTIIWGVLRFTFGSFSPMPAGFSFLSSLFFIIRVKVFTFYLY